MSRILVTASLVVLASLLIEPSRLQGQDAAGAEQTAKTAEKLLRQVSDFLGAKKQFECNISSVMKIEAPGITNNMETKSVFRIDRPARFALQIQSGFNGVDMVSDGETLSIHIPMMQRYVQSEAPATVSEAMNGPAAQSAMMTGPLGGLLPYGGDAFYETMMEGVTKTSYLGESQLDGTLCHHCRFEQDQFSWDLWVKKGKQPLPMKVSLDMSQQMGEVSPMLKDAEIEYSLLFSGWVFEPEFDETSFRFDPPADAEQVEDLFADIFGGNMDDEPHPLLGQPAPVFKVQNLDGETVDLQDHLESNVVILDFWATWCGPCIEALPQIAEVAAAYEDRGVQFFAVNVGEEPSDIRDFLESAELEIPVLLDSEGRISDQYEAEAIPQTVIVGRKGDIQVVHVGLSGNLKEHLSSELDRLLNGEDLAAESLAAAAEAKEAARANDFGTTSAWSFQERCSSVAVDKQQGQIVAVSASGQLTRLAADGTKIESADIAQSGKLRVANLISGGPSELLVFGKWGQSVHAFTAHGERLWDYTLGQGVDDVWAADLNGDGSDNVIVGYNGRTGLHVLDQQGTRLWKYTDIGNVWHVTAADVDGDELQEVVTTSAEGRVHIFSHDGKKKKDIDLPIYATLVRTYRVAEQQPVRMLAAGAGDDGEALVSFDDSGNVKFQVALPSGGVDHVDEMIAADHYPWVAVAMRGGVVHVIDVDAGKIIATVSDQGQTFDVAWWSREAETPMLLTATGRAVNAFEIVRSDTAE